MHYIYVYTNSTNSKSYVGQSVDLKQRQRQHRFNVKKRVYPFYRAIKKYGWNSFNIQVIECCQTQEGANEAENFWIQYLQTKTPNGYNILPGGNTVSGTDHPSYGKPSWNSGQCMTQQHRDNLTLYWKSLSEKPNVRRKLTFKIAEQIRLEYSLGSFSQRALAKKHGINQRAIWDIINNKTYICASN